MITGFVRGQQLKLSSPLIVADTIDYLTALFTFHTRDWAGMETWTHWQNGAVVYDVPLTDDQITEDAHLNLSAGTWEVWVHGNRFEDGEVVQRITTEKARIEVIATGILGGEPFPTVPPSAGEQIIAAAQAAEAGAKSAAEQAAASEAAAGTFADIAKTAAETAVEAKNDAESARDDAAGSAEASAKSAERAEQAATANGYAAFEIQDDGCLYLSRTANIVDKINFQLTDTGNLEVILHG